MIISEDTICRMCERLFCCEKCRRTHEDREHPNSLSNHFEDNNPDDGAAMEYFCPICDQKPLPLRDEINSELMQHINKNHLPLNCQKCSKIYYKIEDLQEFSNCIQAMTADSNKMIFSANCSNKNDVMTVGTQTSPVCNDEVNNFQDEIRDSNLRLIMKSKTKLLTTANEELNSESVFSIKSISSIHNSTGRRSIGLSTTAVSNGVKLVRSTSTPLPGEVAYPLHDHMSSIHSSGNVVSPLVINPETPSKCQLEIKNRYRKIGSHKKKQALTPLRQVMSKSVGKAMAEHRNAQRRKMFDAMDLSDGDQLAITDNSPIDLRLSPVIRRTQNELINAAGTHMRMISILPPAPKIQNDFEHELLLSSKQTTRRTESILISRMEQMSNIHAVRANCQGNGLNRNSIFRARRSIEIVTELSEIRGRSQSFSPASKTLFKTCIDDTCNNDLMQISSVYDDATGIVQQRKSSIHLENMEEHFFSPQATPIKESKLFPIISESNARKDPLKRPSIRPLSERHRTGTASDRLWSLVASIIRLPSFKKMSKNEDSSTKQTGANEKNVEKKSIEEKPSSSISSLIEKSSPIAGYKTLLRDVAEVSKLKRKRAKTIDDQATLSDFDYLETSPSTVSPKRFRIYGRKPIKRMRTKT